MLERTFGPGRAYGCRLPLAELGGFLDPADQVAAAAPATPHRGLDGRSAG
jgi:hypothetical protein